jgi:hypothetical protein
LYNLIQKWEYKSIFTVLNYVYLSRIRFQESLKLVCFAHSFLQIWRQDSRKVK